MRKIFVFLSVLLLLRPVYAGCVSASSTTKCATVPNYIVTYGAIPGDYTDNSWRFLYRKTFNDDEPYHYYSGTSAQITTNGELQYLYCYMTSPFKMTIKAVYDMESQRLMTSNPYEGCANYLRAATIRELLYISVPSDDKCPDGFYTVPYDVSCGEGMIDTADIPNCDDDTSGEYCLMSNGTSCESYSDCGDMLFTNANGVYTLSYTACNGGMCSDASTTDVACGNGYYGNGTTCTKCPGDGTSNTPEYIDNNDGTLSITNNASLITDCYVTPDMYFRDGVGKYRFRNNCNYAE